jgi:hypothetical protein
MVIYTRELTQKTFCRTSTIYYKRSLIDLRTIKKEYCASVDKLIREVFLKSKYGYSNESKLVDKL